MSSHNHNNKHEHSEDREYLVRLSELDYELEDGSPDVMGWDVADQSGKPFGEVEDLLVDMNSGQILFGIICYQPEDTDERCTLVPLAGTQVNEDNKRLVLPMDMVAVMDAPMFGDETQDLQPYFQYWVARMADWAPADEEEVEQHELPPLS